jgi:hypothetical protein
MLDVPGHRFNWLRRVSSRTALDLGRQYIADCAYNLGNVETVLGRRVFVGNLRDLKLPAIDLSPIGNACGGPIDGILGVDLLDKMEVDLKRQVASVGGEPVDPKAVYDEMEKPMGHCPHDLSRGKRRNSNGASIPKSCCTRQTVNSAGEHR